MSKTILEEAAEITSKDRETQYGPPENSFAVVAAMWSAYLGHTVTYRNVCMCLVLLKVARDKHRAKRDNLVDICGYARCAERLLKPDAVSKPEPGEFLAWAHCPACNQPLHLGFSGLDFKVGTKFDCKTCAVGLEMDMVEDSGRVRVKKVNP